MARARVPDAVQRSSRCSAEPGPMAVTSMDPGSAAYHFVLRSVRGTATSTGAGILQHLVHVDHHAVGVTGGGADEEVFHQPAVFFAAGLEPGHGAEIDQFWIDRLAPPEVF